MSLSSMLAGQMGMGVVLQAKNEMSRPANEAERDLKKLQGTAVATGTSLRTNMEGAGVAMLGVARIAFGVAIAVGAIAAPMGVMVKLAAESEYRLANVKTLLVGTGMSAERADAQIRGLDVSIGFLAGRTIQSVADMENASYKLVSALGLKEGSAALETTAQLATAGIGTMQQAAEVMTAIMATYGKAWGDAVPPQEKALRIGEAMAVTIAKNNTTMPQLGEALKYVAGQAAVVGINFNELVTTLGMLQTAGLQGPMAGTGYGAYLRGLYRLMTPEGHKVAPWLKIADEYGKVLPMPDTLDQIQKHLGVTDAQAVKGAKKIKEMGLTGSAAFEAMGISVKSASKLVEMFQEQGSSVVAMLMGQAAELRMATEELEQSQGKLDAMAKARENTTTGQLQMLKNTALTTMKELGAPASEFLVKPIITRLNENLSAINQAMMIMGVGRTIGSVLSNSFGNMASNLALRVGGMGGAPLRFGPSQAIYEAALLKGDYPFGVPDWYPKGIPKTPATTSPSQPTTGNDYSTHKIEIYIDGSGSPELTGRKVAEALDNYYKRGREGKF